MGQRASGHRVRGGASGTGVVVWLVGVGGRGLVGVEIWNRGSGVSVEGW